MNTWTKQRHISFWVHVGFVSIPFLASTISSFLFWQEMFRSWQLAAAMIISVEVLALTGLVLSIMKIESPFIWLKHLLPFISIGPLGYELFKMLAHNGIVMASVFTVIVSSILVYIAHECFKTIENQFVDPIVLARERATSYMAPFIIEMEEQKQREIIFTSAAKNYFKEKGVTLQPAQQKKLETGETTELLKPCPKCGTPLEYMKYVQAHRKLRDGSYKGCDNCYEAVG